MGDPDNADSGYGFPGAHIGDRRNSRLGRNPACCRRLSPGLDQFQLHDPDLHPHRRADHAKVGFSCLHSFLGEAALEVWEAAPQ
jgi:hypothetical protein